MKNSFVDIHNLLIEQMEIMRDPESTDTDIRKAEAMASLGMVAVKNGELMLKADKLYNANEIEDKKLFIGKD